MTLRERIADWISGGALTEAHGRILATQMDEVQCSMHYAQLNLRLSRIASLETPKASHTVKRMARIARGEE